MLLLFTLVSCLLGLSFSLSPTDIPTCGYAPGWDCAKHPWVEPEAYCNSVKASSVGKTPVPYLPMESIYALMHYWYPGNNSYKAPNGLPNVRPLRDSWGYQYYSLEHEAFRWDQLFALDYYYDEFTASKKPGAQLFETARASANLLIDINIPNGPDTGVLDKDHRFANAACAFVPAPIWKLMNYADLKNSNITTYCGATIFPSGFFQVGTNFDVYMMVDRWFPVPQLPIFWYVDRDTGSIAGQLYYQSLALNGGGSQNYFWDFSRRIVPDSVAKKMFRSNPHYYFDINLDMVKRGCSDEIFQVVVKDQFPDTFCCGAPGSCTPQNCVD